MTNGEILSKAIVKAQQNGLMNNYDESENNRQVQWYSIIFTHIFAKAFWGEEKITVPAYPIPEDGIPDDYVKIVAWQYHLQQMVLEEKPLEYLKRYL